jgi:hypothetical protein
MILARTVLIACGLLGTICAAGAGEYRDLFNGKDLDGWVVEGPKENKQGLANWTVKDGTIICRGAGFGFLRYDSLTSLFASSIALQHRSRIGGATAALAFAPFRSTPSDLF